MSKPSLTLAWAVAVALAGLALANAPPATPAGYATPAPLAAKNLLLAGARIGPRLVAVGEHGNVMVSDDHGQAWQQAKTVPTVTTLTALHFLDTRHGWAVGHGGVVIATTDTGDNWTTLAGKLDGPEVLLSVWFSTPQAGLVVGAFGYAASTDDGGKTWKRFEIAPGEDGERHLNQIFSGPGGSLWVAAEGGLLFRSDDGARSWQKLVLPYKGSIWGGMTLADGTLLVWGMRGHVLRSDDGGKTFSEQTTGTDQSIGGGTQLADGTVVLAGLGGAVLTGDPSGRQWRATIREDRVGQSAVLPGAPGQVLLLGQGGVQAHALKP